MLTCTVFVRVCEREEREEGGWSEFLKGAKLLNTYSKTGFVLIYRYSNFL